MVKKKHFIPIIIDLNVYTKMGVMLSIGKTIENVTTILNHPILVC